MGSHRVIEPQRVLIVGIDPTTIAGVDAAAVRAGLDWGLQRFVGTGWVAEECLVPLDESTEQRIVDALTASRYDCVVVGGGIRKPESLLELFERVVNLIRVHAPDAAIAFNTDGARSYEAVLRVLG